MANKNCAPKHVFTKNRRVTKVKFKYLGEKIQPNAVDNV